MDAYLLDLGLDELPGVGWNMCHKLKDMGISSVRQVRATTKEALQRELGNKTGITIPFTDCCNVQLHKAVQLCAMSNTCSYKYSKLSL